MLECSGCGLTKDVSAFYADKTITRGRRTRCKSCDGKYMAAYRRKARRDPTRWASDVLPYIKGRAKARGIPFAITVADLVVPECCPVTGERLVFGQAKHPNSPSVDRLIPELGYVPRNVAVISLLANRIKAECTDPSVFRKLADWLEERRNLAQAQGFIEAVIEVREAQAIARAA